jgi:hypothetical protein
MDQISEYSTKLIKYNPNNEEKISQFLKSLSPISHITFESENCKVDLDDEVLVRILVEFQTKKGCTYDIWKHVDQGFIDLYEYNYGRSTRSYLYNLDGKCTYYSICNKDGGSKFTWTPTFITLQFSELTNCSAKTYDTKTRKLTKLFKIRNDGITYSIKRISLSKLAVKFTQYMPIDPKLGDTLKDFNDVLKDFNDVLKDFNDDKGLSDNITPESVLYNNWKL